MHDKVRIELIKYLNEIRRQHKAQVTRLSDLNGYETERLQVNRHKSGGKYYRLYNSDTGKYQYLGKADHPEVHKIQEAHFLSRSVKELEHEIMMIDKVLKLSKDISFESIDNSLSLAYRGAVPKCDGNSELARKWKLSMESYKKTFPPFRPEELISSTRDGTMVRSKSEALIYNYLLEIGATFVYELPLRIRIGNKDSLLLPDFSILSEIDYKSVIYIEHQGMMNTPKYRDRFNETVYKYWLNDYLPERDVFFTFDLRNGGFDDTPIRNIIHRYVRPEIL